MQIKSIRVTDGTNNTSSYSYSDRSGAWQSIVGVAGESQAYIAMHTLTAAQRAQQNWNNLSPAAKIGIGCAIGGVFLIGFIAFAFYFISQRRAGRAERQLADKEWEQHTNELADYRRMMAKGQFAIQHMGHGEKY